MDGDRRGGKAKASTRKAPQTPRAAAPKKPAAQPAQPVHAQQERVKGFALDLSMGGRDEHDHDFRESA